MNHYFDYTRFPGWEHHYRKIFSKLKEVKIIILSISLDSQFPDRITVLEV